jgi:hypothetical protein
VVVDSPTSSHHPPPPPPELSVIATSLHPLHMTLESPIRRALLDCPPTRRRTRVHTPARTHHPRRDARRTRHEHECYIHRARAIYSHYGGCLHRRCAHLSPPRVAAWNTHTVCRASAFMRASACAMRLSRRVLLWYLSAGTYAQARSTMAMSAALALETERAGRGDRSVSE